MKNNLLHPSSLEIELIELVKKIWLYNQKSYS